MKLKATGKNFETPSHILFAFHYGVHSYTVMLYCLLAKAPGGVILDYWTIRCLSRRGIGRGFKHLSVLRRRQISLPPELVKRFSIENLHVEQALVTR